MMRTWRSVSPVLVSAFPPSPAPGPCDSDGRGATVPDSSSPYCRPQVPPVPSGEAVVFGAPALRGSGVLSLGSGVESQGRLGGKEGDVSLES